MADIVTVADECHPKTGESLELLFEGHDVGQRLARVMFVGQGVDDRDGGVVSKLVDSGLLEGPDHQGREIARQDASRVGNRLAAAEL